MKIQAINNVINYSNKKIEQKPINKELLFAEVLNKYINNEKSITKINSINNNQDLFKDIVFTNPKYKNFDFNISMQIRDRALKAYNEIMNMQI